ncbi:MAG: hypothetical protein DYG92_02425 [Leptolyngbya sp. PLA1]|nr:hypothetical protein [Leptolyngbya sp. PLA1]
MHLAAFGKHPGWDDHIEEIGLDHEDLVRIKRELYAEGLAGNIDSGAWEKLPDEQRLPAFKHLFYWRRSAGLVIGRMWSSRDGKGRTKYPMVVCAMIEGVPDAWAIQQVLPRLEQVEAKCVQTNSAELVRLAIGEARRGLDDQAALLASSGVSQSGDDAGVLKALLTSPGLNIPEESGGGLTRVLYEIDREMGEFKGGAGAKRTASKIVGEAGAQHIRVPRCLQPAGEAARAWMLLLAQDIADSTPVLVIEPMDAAFVDIIVGNPRPQQFFCVRASDKGLALTSEVPYTIDPAFKTATAERVKAWCAGNVRLPGRRGAMAGGAPAEGAGESKGFPRGVLIAAGGVIAAIVIGAGVLAALSGRSEEPKPEPAPESPGPQGNAVPQATPPKATEKPTPPKAAPSYGADDPRAGWDIDDQVTRARALLAALEVELAAEGLKPDPAVKARIDRAADRADNFVRGRALSAASRDAIVSDMASVDGEIRAVMTALKGDIDRSHERVRAFLDEEASQAQVKSDALKRAWSAGLRAIDHTKGWEHARARHAAVVAALKEAEELLAASGELKAPTLAEVQTPALAAVIDARREKAMQEVAAAAGTGDSARSGAVARELSAWTEGARSLFAQAGRLSELLAGGYAWSEAAAGGDSIKSLHEQLPGMPAWNEFSAALAGLDARCIALRDIAAGGDARSLIATIRKSRADLAKLGLSEANTAWARLGEVPGWPSTPEDARDAGRVLKEDMLAIIGREPSAERRTELEASARKAGAQVWSRFVSTAAVDAAGVNAALDTRGVLGADDTAEQGVPDWARFNLAKGRLSRAVDAADALPGRARVDAIRAAMEGFVALSSSLPVASRAEAKQLIDAMKDLLDSPGEIDLAKLGPGGAGFELVSSDAESVVYRLGSTPVEFRRLEPTGEGVSFVSTTEMSVGGFIDLVGGRGEEFRSIMPRSDAGGVDPRVGPRVWVWQGSALAVTSPAGPGDLGQGWVRIKTQMAGREYYPPGLKVDPPSRDHPMQYLSPHAAVLAARLAGCRLPTLDEWTAAGGAVGGTNLRDLSWKKEHDHLRQFASSGPEFPGAGLFWPAGVTRKSPLEDDQAAVSTDDGWVWFAPVSTGDGRFKHLAGNVAEYVTHEAVDWDGLVATREAVDAAVGKGEKIRIVGGSALSPSDVKLDQPYPITPQSREGYSDVGFRLAFGAPKAAAAASTSERVRKALGASGYLSDLQRK